MFKYTLYIYIYENLDIENYYISNYIEQYQCFNYSTPVIVEGRYGTTFYGNLVFYIIKSQNETKEYVNQMKKLMKKFKMVGFKQIIYLHM